MSQHKLFRDTACVAYHGSIRENAVPNEAYLIPRREQTTALRAAALAGVSPLTRVRAPVSQLYGTRW